VTKLQELHPMINIGKTAVLFLPNDHPGNNEKEDIKIFDSRDSTGLYRRKLVYVNRSLPVHPTGQTYSTWQGLLEDSSELEITSDQWKLLN